MATFSSTGRKVSAKVLGVIAGILAGVGIIKWLAGLVTAFTTLGTLGGPLSTLFGSSGTALGAISAPVWIAVAAIAALAAGLAWVYATNEEVRISVNEALGNVWGALSNALQTITDTALPSLQAGWEGLMQILAPLGDFLSGMFYSIWMGMIVPALNYLAETVIPTVTGVFLNFWNNVLVPLASFIGSVLEPVISFLAGVLTSLWQNVVVPLAGAIGEVLAKAFEGISEVLNVTVIPIFTAF